MWQDWHERCSDHLQECKKAVHSALKKSNQSSKHCCHHNDSYSDSDYHYWSVGLDSTGELHVVKKHKSSESVVTNMPCPIKAIPSKSSNKPVEQSDDLGVTALVAIMEPATENLSSKAPKVPLRSCHSNKIQCAPGHRFQSRPIFPWKRKTQAFSLPD